MSLVIKKTINLGFLGDGYADAYLVFKSIPLKDYEELLSSVPSEDNKKSLDFMLDNLKKYFVSGKFPDEENKLQTVDKEDLGDLDSATAIRCFSLLTGQELDPKLETPLTNTSSMEPLPQ